MRAGPLTGHALASAPPRTVPWRQVGMSVGALVLLGTWLFALGDAPLFDVDEGAFAEASREMLESGDWGHTTLNGADRFDKPILVYWLQASSLALFGASEFAVRLPSALCGWGWCLALAGFAGPRWGWRTGALAAALLAGSAGPLVIGRAATADSLLNLLLTLTLLDLWRFIEATGQGTSLPHGAAAARPLRRAFLWAALGLLAKGPVAVVVPAGAALVWAAAGGASARRACARALGDPTAWAIGAAVALPWYAYALQRHGGRFVDGFLLHHNVARFAGAFEGHGGTAGYYLLVVPLLLWPWTPLLAGSRPWRTAWSEPAGRWLLAWALFVPAFFTLSATKLPHYALYGLAPLVLMAARELATAPAARWRLAATGVAVLASGAAALLLPNTLAAIAARLGDAHRQALLQAIPDLAARSTPGAWTLCVIALGAWLLVTLAWTSGSRAFGRRPGAGAPSRLDPATALAVAGVMVASLLWAGWAMRLVGEATQGPIKRLAQHARREGAALTQWRLDRPSVGFYRGTPAPRREAMPNEWAIARADRAPDTTLPATAGAPVPTVVARDGAYVLVAPVADGARR